MSYIPNFDFKILWLATWNIFIDTILTKVSTIQINVCVKKKCYVQLAMIT